MRSFAAIVAEFSEVAEYLFDSYRWRGVLRVVRLPIEGPSLHMWRQGMIYG
jgi:hypothetical protein